ncbi:hypothetical protein EDD18DRAFT_1020434, partial [Armillaria luteobubalina]
VWRCWIVWGHHWLIILMPVLCLLAATGIVNSGNLAMKVLYTYHSVHDTINSMQDASVYGTSGLWIILYTSFTMATTILCTLLIIYRILTISHRGMGIRTFRGIIEIIVESALIYSSTLLVYLILVACKSHKGTYFAILASFARGIAPTLIVGRVAAGHARPEESW